MVNTLGQPAVQMLTFASGAIALADEDVTKPLLLGFPNPVSSPYASVPISVVTDRVNSYCGCFPTINRPIAAGATDTFHFSLRFGPAGSRVTTLAGDVYQNFASAFPVTLPPWPDHRAIGSIHLATNTLGQTGWTTNPRGYLFDSSVDVTTPAGLFTFQQRMLQWANYEISLLQSMNAQGMIAWDVEGQQFGPYNGDPTQLATLSPEMASIVDQWFQRFTDAGFRVGVTIRPQQLVLGPNLSSAQQNFVTDPAQITQLLLTKAKYAHDHWGATLFYIDSNVKNWNDPSAIDATIFKNLQAAMPDSMFMPEHSVTQYWAGTVPYLELQGGFASTPDPVRFTYPDAFSLIYTADGDLQGNFDTLISGVKQGDILLYRSWFDDEPANQTVQSIYQAAGKTATSTTISINPIGPTVALGQPEQFTATVMGTTNQQVTWTVAPAGVGSISSAGVYTAPPTTPSQQTIIVKATSAADPTKIASAAISFTASVGVSVNPVSTSLTAGQTQQFTANITGTTNQQVTWSVLSGGPGTISPSGLYAAPSSITSQQTVTVAATSVADPTKTATGTITLTPSGIFLTPQTASLSGGQTQQFTPSISGTTNQQVTWTVLAGGAGTISTSGLYTAPASITTQQTVTVQATSAADMTKTAIASITLTPTVGISVSPQTVSLSAGQTKQFTPTLTGTTNQQVTWTVLSGGAGTISTSGLYTAPASITTQQTVTIRATSAADAAKSATATITLTPPAAPACDAPSTGAFTGCYFNDTTLGTTGGLAFSRVDPQINFNWNNNAPGGNLGLYNYSVRWQGYFTFAAAPYTFTLSTDDGSRLYVDGNLVIDDWSVHPSTAISHTYTVTAGSHLIELDYFQAGGGATANLSWVNSQPPPAPSCGAPNTNAFTGCYFGDTTLGTSSGIAFSRVDQQINFDWSANGPGGNLGTSNYSVKWQGNFNFNAGPYTFTLATDDGSRLYIDGQLVVDDWSAHAAYTITQSYTMTAGPHLLELDYFQAGGGASASLSWAGSQQPIGISVTPSTASLPAGQTKQFTASVTGTTNQQVTWSVLSGGPGTISSSGLYTSPASITAQQSVIIQATSAADSTKTASAAITLTPAASTGGSCGAPGTNAFTGCYFGDMNLGSSSGLAFSRVDPQINFDWSANGPGGSLGTTNYSVKWQGNFNFNAGPYTFTLSTDDGSRLYVDGNLVIDDWSAHAAYTITQSYTMTPGNHLIELDYFQAGGGAVANLSWGQPATCGAPSTNAFTGCYFADTTLGSSGGLAFSRVDPRINFNWSGSGPGGGNLGAYNYSVRWQGNFDFNAGVYIFTLSTDDGSRLYVDGQLVIDDWSVHAASPITQSYTMSAGTHLIEVDYFQAGGDAIASLAWTAAP